MTAIGQITKLAIDGQGLVEEVPVNKVIESPKRVTVNPVLSNEDFLRVLSEYPEIFDFLQDLEISRLAGEDSSIESIAKALSNLENKRETLSLARKVKEQGFSSTETFFAELLTRLGMGTVPETNQERQEKAVLEARAFLKGPGGEYKNPLRSRMAQERLKASFDEFLMSFDNESLSGFSNELRGSQAAGLKLGGKSENSFSKQLDEILAKVLKRVNNANELTDEEIADEVLALIDSNSAIKDFVLSVSAPYYDAHQSKKEQNTKITNQVLDSQRKRRIGKKRKSIRLQNFRKAGLLKRIKRARENFKQWKAKKLEEERVKEAEQLARRNSRRVQAKINKEIDNNGSAIKRFSSRLFEEKFVLKENDDSASKLAAKISRLSDLTREVYLEREAPGSEGITGRFLGAVFKELNGQEKLKTNQVLGVVNQKLEEGEFLETRKAFIDKAQAKLEAVVEERRIKLAKLIETKAIYEQAKALIALCKKAYINSWMPKYRKEIAAKIISFGNYPTIKKVFIALEGMKEAKNTKQLQLDKRALNNAYETLEYIVINYEDHEQDPAEVIEKFIEDQFDFIQYRMMFDKNLIADANEKSVHIKIPAFFDRLVSKVKRFSDFSTVFDQAGLALDEYIRASGSELEEVVGHLDKACDLYNNSEDLTKMIKRYYVGLKVIVSAVDKANVGNRELRLLCNSKEYQSGQLELLFYLIQFLIVGGRMQGETRLNALRSEIEEYVRSVRLR